MKKINLIILSVFSFYVSFAQTYPPKEAYSLDVKQIHSGHSLTDPLFVNPWPGQYVNLITLLRGVWANDDIGKSTIPGSPMSWRWDNEHTVSPSARYDIADWEVLIITEGVPLWDINISNQYFSLYVNNAWENGNQGNGAPTLLWTTWTNINNSDGPWRETLDNYEPLWEQMMDYANANRPNGSTPVYIIPGHRMMARLYDDIQEGIVPDIATIEDFFDDTIHTNTLGNYAIALIHYACIFNESPVGLPNDLLQNSDYNAPTPELALYLQNMIWEVVTSYERSGVVDDLLSSSDDISVANIQIYPNPVTEYLYIEKKQTNIDLQNRIYNINGQLIYEGKGNQINMSEFSSGIYFLKIGNLTKKIIKK